MTLQDLVQRAVLHVKVAAEAERDGNIITAISRQKLAGACLDNASERLRELIQWSNREVDRLKAIENTNGSQAAR